MVAVTGLAGVEHHQADGSFAPYQPGRPVPTPIRAGDRLHVRLAAADLWLYALAVIRQADYWKLGEWSPEPRAIEPRLLWPGGRVLTATDAAMTTLLVVASSEPLPWASELTRADCSALVGKMPPRPPVTACAHLYGLFWKVPKRVRGLVAPDVAVLEDGALKLPAIVAAHTGTPYTALEWQFTSRD